MTANYGNERTNANLSETILNTGNVTPDTFGKVATFPVDGQIYAQPLYVAGVKFGGTPHNVVFVATMENSIYAIDADSITLLWKANFGTAVSCDYLDFDDIEPEVGILSTPVIDPGRNAIYFVTDNFSNGNVVFRLHAVDLVSGFEKPGSPVDIHATIPGTGDGAVDGMVAFNARQHLQRPGLLLKNDRIYIAFGSHADTYPYHGWIFAYSADNVQKQAAVFNSTPNGSAGSVWQSGRGLASDGDGNIYAGTANGDYDGETNFSESFLKLSPDLKLLDWYTPQDWQELSSRDHDLGSLGPLFVPGTQRLVGGDKFGNLYLLDSQKMGHLGKNDAEMPQIVRPVMFGGIFSSALWASDQGPILYLVEEGDWTASLRISDGRFEPSMLSQSVSVTSDIPYQGMAVSARGGTAGTGILWMTTGDHEQDDVPGTLHAFDALDLTNELWNSGQNPDRDSLGGFAKFVAPTVANGRVYVPTFSNRLTVYGLLPQDPGAQTSDVVPQGAGTRSKRPVRNGQVRPEKRR